MHKTFPTHDEFFGQPPSQRKAFINSLSPEDRIFLFERLADTTQPSEETIAGSIEGAFDAKRTTLAKLDAEKFFKSETQRRECCEWLDTITRDTIIESMKAGFRRKAVVVEKFTGDAATDIDDIATTSRKAAAKTKKQFETYAKNGRASARTKREESGRDALKETIIAEVNKLKRERDKNYPDRNSGGEKGPSDNQIYLTVANRYIGANKKPIYTPAQIKEWFKPSKVKRRGGHKRK